MSGWTRWNRLTGTSRYPDESPRVILSVEPVPPIPGKRQGPGGPVRWAVEVLVKDASLQLGAKLVPVSSGEAADCSAGRAAVELAYRATDAATRAGASVVASQVTDRGTGADAPTSDRATVEEVQ